MTLRELLAIKNVRQLIQEQFTQLEALGELKPNEIDKYLTYIVFKAENALKPLLAMESLYDQEASFEVLENIFNTYGLSLYTNAILHSLLLNNSFRDFDNIGKLINDNEQLIGYQGFDLTNQDGNFQSIKNKATTLGSQRLQYMGVLDVSAKQIVDNIARDIKKNLLRLIY